MHCHQKPSPAPAIAQKNSTAGVKPTTNKNNYVMNIRRAAYYYEAAEAAT